MTISKLENILDENVMKVLELLIEKHSLKYMNKIGKEWVVTFDEVYKTHYPTNFRERNGHYNNKLKRYIRGKILETYSDELNIKDDKNE